MKNLVILLFRSFLPGYRNRESLVLEYAALQQQFGVLHRQVKRPRLTGSDRLFWVALRRVWPRWDEVLTIVKPATVIVWHWAGVHFGGQACPGGPCLTNRWSIACENGKLQAWSRAGRRYHRWVVGGEFRLLGFREGHPPFQPLALRVVQPIFPPHGLISLVSTPDWL